MSRPKISEATYRMWDMFPLSRPGVTFTSQQLRLIREMIDGSDSAGAQTVILDRLRFNSSSGPRVKARMRHGRKFIVAAQPRQRYPTFGHGLGEAIARSLAAGRARLEAGIVETPTGPKLVEVSIAKGKVNENWD